jgi:hypothetical protein
VGTQLGFPQIVGLTAMGSFYWKERPRFDVDFLWEPSSYLQSYSVGAAYHPADRMFFLGVRLRFLELGAPWRHGYHAVASDQLGLGLEAGLRKALGWERRVLIHFTLQGTAIPTETSQLEWLFGLNLGVSYAVLLR